jgi:hypothetical protein
VSGISEFFSAMWREVVEGWNLLMDFLLNVFEPQSGWIPKAILGAVLLLVIFWISKRGTRS